MNATEGLEPLELLAGIGVLYVLACEEERTAHGEALARVLLAKTWLRDKLRHLDVGLGKP